jgi:AcrR family transcriptional regulator
VGRAVRPGRYDVESIVDVAVQVFLERGYDATSMADLAAATGLRKPSLYHHVTGKEDLLRRGISRAIGAYTAVFDEPQAAATADPVARLRYVLRRTVVVISALLPETALLIRARGNTETERWALTERRRLNGRMAAVIEAAWGTAGGPPGLPAPTAARLVLGTATSLVDWYRPDDGPTDPSAMADAIVALLLPGLLPDFQSGTALGR